MRRAGGRPRLGARLAAALAAAVAGLTLVVAPPAAAGRDKALDDLLFELQLVPLDEPPAAFELERFADGKTVTLAELRGRPVLLYFWATW